MEPQLKIEDQLGRELEAWLTMGLTAAIWWRDDDARSDTPQLRRLLDIAVGSQIVVALGVVPRGADDTLVNLVSGKHCCIWQHGLSHDFHVSGEFGDGRSLPIMMKDALCGQRALDRLFGPAGWQPVFVPPNHSLSMTFKSLIPYLGYVGLSAGVPLTPLLDHVSEVNAEIDLMSWPDGEILPETAISEMLIEQLKLRRERKVPVDRPIGILTHHLVFDVKAWSFVSRLLEFLRSHRAVKMLDADRLFEANHAPFEQTVFLKKVASSSRTDDVTVVLTSCGRPDLLARTLDSFLKYTTYPIRAFIVIEDGVAQSTLAVAERFRQQKIRWLCTGKKVGQILAIDLAYKHVATPYIFHCEDDWEFSAPGFIERSLSVLKQNEKILQVWIR